MLYKNLVIHSDHTTLLQNSVLLFRIKTSELAKPDGSAFCRIEGTGSAFALHLVIDSIPKYQKEYDRLLYRIFLLLGKENYDSSVNQKSFFISYPLSDTASAAAFHFKLRQLLSPTVRFEMIASGKNFTFQSNQHIFLAEDPSVTLDNHFNNYLQKIEAHELLSASTVLPYIMITEIPVDTNGLDKLVINRLQAIPDMMSVFKNLGRQINRQQEILAYNKKDNNALLHTLSFLKKEAKTNFLQKEKALSHIEEIEKLNMDLVQKNTFSNRDFKDVAYEAGILKQIRETREKYQTEYEELPMMYKKLGTVLKIITGKKELSYFLSDRQKTAFMDMLNALPKEKQLSTWYYYEYEILPEWYKKLGRLFIKNK